MKEKINYTYIIGLTIIGIFVLIIFTITSKVKTEIDYSCNTGFIGIDFDGKWVNENKTSIYNNNLTYYSSQFLPNYLKLKNLDGLNCQGKLKIEAPTNFIKEILK